MKTTIPVIIGIDTHKATHVAVAIDTQGTRLAALSIPTNPKGYLELERWSRSFGEVLAFGIEGTGSYGAGLSRSLLAQGHTVIEVTRPNRQLRYTHGKTDSLDAEGAARSVLSGQATALPKTQTGSSEMIRHLKIARDTAVKSRSQAMVTLKTLIINAPADLRDALDQIQGKVALIRHVVAFRPGDIDSPLASAKVAMRALARRWLWLHEEIIAHDKELERLVTKRAPDLMASHGIATLTVAETINGLYKSELVHRQGPWRNMQDLEMATLGWIDWFNNRRLLGPVGNIPPAEAEENFYAQRDVLDMVA